MPGMHRTTEYREPAPSIGAYGFGGFLKRGARAAAKAGKAKAKDAAKVAVSKGKEMAKEKAKEVIGMGKEKLKSMIVDKIRGKLGDDIADAVASQLKGLKKGGKVAKRRNKKASRKHAARRRR